MLAKEGNSSLLLFIFYSSELLCFSFPCLPVVSTTGSVPAPSFPFSSDPYGGAAAYVRPCVRGGARFPHASRTVCPVAAVTWELSAVAAPCLVCKRQRKVDWLLPCCSPWKWHIRAGAGGAFSPQILRNTRACLLSWFVFFKFVRQRSYCQPSPLNTNAGRHWNRIPPV